MSREKKTIKRLANRNQELRSQVEQLQQGIAFFRALAKQNEKAFEENAPNQYQAWKEAIKLRQQAQKR